MGIWVHELDQTVEKKKEDKISDKKSDLYMNSSEATNGYLMVCSLMLKIGRQRTETTSYGSQ